MRIPGLESNHNGGEVFFGPDNFMYIFTGDGGGGNDVHGTCGNGQDTTVLLGKILRIAPIVPERPNEAGAFDCSSGIYRIPASNPFSGAGGNCNEIYAWGLRNPWRNDFDSATGDLYVGDVGQECWEEVNYIPAGTLAARNFGWRQMEGNHCFNGSTPFTCNPVPGRLRQLAGLQRPEPDRPGARGSPNDRCVLDDGRRRVPRLPHAGAPGEVLLQRLLFGLRA